MPERSLKIVKNYFTNCGDKVLLKTVANSAGCSGSKSLSPWNGGCDI